jgi:hypothetical protein
VPNKNQIFYIKAVGPLTMPCFINYLWLSSVLVTIYVLSAERAKAISIAFRLMRSWIQLFGLFRVQNQPHTFRDYMAAEPITRPINHTGRLKMLLTGFRPQTPPLPNLINCCPNRLSQVRVLRIMCTSCFKLVILKRTGYWNMTRAPA